VSHRRQRQIDRLRLVADALARLDERAQRAHVHRGDREIADERVDVLQGPSVVTDRAQVPVLREESRRSLSEAARRSNTEYRGLPRLLEPPDQVLLRLAEVALASAFAKSAASDALVDVPDLAFADESRHALASHINSPFG